MKRNLLYAVAGTFILFSGCSIEKSGEAPFVKLAKGRKILCINGDNDHYFKAGNMRTMLPIHERWDEKGAKKYIDILTSGNKVTHLFLCAIGQRASYDSKACDPIWLAIDEAKERGIEPNEWPVNAKKNFDNGVDPYKVWCDYARKKGNVSVWISMRMNDVHNIDKPWNIRTNRFWYEHPELHRFPDHDRKKGGLWTMHALDYAKKEVQDFQFGIFKELVDRYDADGYELDWLRFWEHLTPGKERELSYVLTDFMKRCKAYTQEVAKKRGHPIYLSTRVPTSYEAARSLGFDPETWAREGIVEMIAIANFWASIDYNYDFAEWKKRIKEANPRVTVIASACDNVSAGPGLPVIGANIEAWRGWASNAYAQDAEGVYFFNFAYKPESMQKEMFTDGFFEKECSTKPRRYIVTYHDCVRVPKLEAKNQLPVSAAKDVEVKVRVGYPKAAKKLEVIVGFDCEVAAPEVTLNGVKATSATKLKKFTAMRKPAKQFWSLSFPLTAAKQGFNTISLKGMPGAKRLIWAEVAIDVQ